MFFVKTRDGSYGMMNKTPNNELLPVFDVLNHRKLAKVMYGYTAGSCDELSLRVGDVVEIISRDGSVTGAKGWWLGTIQGTNHYGLFPFNYVVLM